MDAAVTALPALATGLGAVVLAGGAWLLGAAAWLVRLLALAGLHVAYALGAAAGVLGSAVAWPFGFIFGVIFVIFSPVIYTVAYAFAPFWYIIGVVPKLEPLFIFFGSAAFVGVVAGISVKMTSHVFVSVLRLDKASAGESGLVRRPSSTTSSANTSMPSSAAAPVKRAGEDDFLLTSGAPPSEVDWQVIDRIEMVPNSEHMRRMPLLQSIILEEEEDDSSVGGY